MTQADRDSAIAWAVRSSDPEFEDWEALAAWAEGDEARCRAYREAMATLADTIDVMAAFPGEGDLAPLATDTLAWQEVVVPFRPTARPSWRRWLPAGGLALAAAVAGVLLVPRPAQLSDMQVVEAPAGQRKRVALADGSVLELAGGSRVTLDAGQPRRVIVERGRAMFTVRHDAATPFRVTAGWYDIVDIGTAFEVVQDGEATDVSVAEGAVVIDPDRTDLRLDAGDGALLRGNAAPQRIAVSPETVAQWRRDRLSYRDAPLAQVAADLSAVLGHPVAVGTGLKDRRFTGSLAVAGVRDQPEQLAELLDVRVRGDRTRWELVAR